MDGRKDEKLSIRGSSETSLKLERAVYSDEFYSSEDDFGSILELSYPTRQNHKPRRYSVPSPSIFHQYQAAKNLLGFSLIGLLCVFTG